MTLSSQLTERVDILQPSPSDDGYGGKSITWGTLATVFAQVSPINTYARERNVADKVASVAGYRVTIRQRDDVDASMRIVWKGRTLAIHSLHETATTLDILTYEENV